jgi:hypothetical protein
MEEMTRLGDIAASQGKSFDQLTEAVLDAGTGEFERLKEFGIQAHKNGEVVEMSFKGITKEVKNTPEAIQTAILSFGEMEGVAGSMAAISQTLEGRMSNLGDGFDSMKLAIGDRLMPVFGFLIEMFSTAVGYITDLISGNIDLGESSTFLGSVFEALGKIFGSVYNIVSEIVQIGIELFGTLWEIVDSVVGLSGTGSVLTGVLNAVGNALKIVGTVAIAALTGVQVLADGLLMLVNKGKEVANFFGAEFKINPAANFDTLGKNATENFARIEKMWTSTSKTGADTQIKEIARATTEHGKEADKQTDKEKKEADKRLKEAEKLAKDKEKAEDSMLKKIEDMGIKAILDDTTRKIAKADLDYKREVASINASLASVASKEKALEAAEKLHTAEIVKIKADGLVKEEKDRADQAKKIAAETKKKEEEEQKSRVEKLKLDKLLLDNEFQAEIEKAKLTLELTKDNSAARFLAVKTLKDLEWDYKSKQLQAEAIAEKARIAESIKDKDLAAKAVKNIEDELNAKLTLGANKLANDKKKIDADALSERRKKNDEFYSALNTAMSGDLNAMLKFLQSKNVAEEGSLSKRLQDNMQHIQGVGNAMLAGIDSLTKLNASYTEGQIKRLDKEKETNFKKLDDEFAKGKLTKEELEKAKTGITAKYDAEVLELKKKEFERNKKMQIATALIQGSMAVLSALATPPFPLGIAMAVIAGVKTAIDINKIRNTKFEGAKGGVFRNAGVAEGSRHGSEYGAAGIQMIDRVSGQEIGEIEGGEPVMVLSRKTYANNKPVIDRLLDSSLNRNGEPITMQDGGILPIRVADSYYQQSYAKGGVVRRMFEDGGTLNYDGGKPTYENSDTGGGDGSTVSPQVIADIQEGKKLQENTEKNTKDTAINTANIANLVQQSNQLLNEIKNKPSGVSLHDINSAVDRAVAATQKSNL